MDLNTFYELLSPIGQEALRAAQNLQPREKDFLPHFQRMCKDFPREIARGALTTAILRLEAAAKFVQAPQMYFTREALEQASNFEVARHRAARYRDVTQIVDLGCSIGGDTLALAAAAPTIGIDRDPLRLAMAQANTRALRLNAEFIQTDLRHAFPCLQPRPETALFFDPARRINGRRIFSVEKYIPPLSSAVHWLSDFAGMGVKVSPAVRLHEITSYDAEVEFVSLRGELKEAVLWFGALKRGRRQATVLPGPHTMIDDGSLSEIADCLSEPRRYFYEPDPAVLRAGMVQNLMVTLQAAQVDREIAYLTADQRVTTPFARVWEVEAWFPFQLKRLRAYLRERQVGLVTVKKRGSAIQPEELIRALRLAKEMPAERIVFLTQLQGRPIVVVCYPNIIHG